MKKKKVHNRSLLTERFRRIDYIKNLFRNYIRRRELYNRAIVYGLDVRKYGKWLGFKNHFF